MSGSDFEGDEKYSVSTQISTDKLDRSRIAC